MTADLTRDSTATFHEKVRQMQADLARGHDVTPSLSFLRELAESHLGEPARLAVARAEGVRKGVEKAARAIRKHRKSIREGTHYGNTYVEAVEDVEALIRALLRGQGGADA